MRAKNPENVTSVPPMQKSTMSTQMNQDDMTKYRSSKKVDATITKIMAPFALISRVSFSESFLAVSDS